MVENLTDKVYNIARGDIMYKELGIDDEVVDLINKSELECKEVLE